MAKNIIEVKKIDDETDKVSIHKVKIKRVKMKNLSEAGRAFLPFVDEFETIVNKGQGLSQTDMLDLITKHRDHVMMLAEVLTDKDFEFYEDVEPLEFYNVMSELVEYSGDFFLTQILIPSQKLAKKILLVGLTANSSLTNTDIQNQKL